MSVAYSVSHLFTPSISQAPSSQSVNQSVTHLIGQKLSNKQVTFYLGVTKFNIKHYTWICVAIKNKSENRTMHVAKYLKDPKVTGVIVMVTLCDLDD